MNQCHGSGTQRRPWMTPPVTGVIGWRHIPPGCESALVVGVRLGRDFWIYFTGQTISQVGSSFTNFALPLLVFKLTGSPTNLALTTAAEFVPYLLFGLVLGAVVDRVDRKRLMISVDLVRAAVISVLPALSLLGVLRVEEIYAVA